MKRNNAGYSLFELLFVIGGLVAVGVMVAVVWVAVHFISKWW
jgi:hypothetical protein